MTLFCFDVIRIFNICLADYIIIMSKSKIEWQELHCHIAKYDTIISIIGIRHYNIRLIVMISTYNKIRISGNQEIYCYGILVSQLIIIYLLICTCVIVLVQAVVQVLPYLRTCTLTHLSRYLRIWALAQVHTYEFAQVITHLRTCETNCTLALVLNHFHNYVLPKVLDHLCTCATTCASTFTLSDLRSHALAHFHIYALVQVLAQPLAHSRIYLRTFLLAHLPEYLLTHASTCTLTHLSKYLCTCVLAHLRNCLLAYLRTSALLHVLTCKSSCALMHLSKYLRTCVLAHILTSTNICALKTLAHWLLYF